MLNLYEYHIFISQWPDWFHFRINSCFIVLVIHCSCLAAGRIDPSGMAALTCYVTVLCVIVEQ